MENLSEILDVTVPWENAAFYGLAIIAVLSIIVLILAVKRNHAIIAVVGGVGLLVAFFGSMVASTEAGYQAEDMRIEKLQQIVETKYGLVMDGEDLHKIASDKKSFRSDSTGMTDLPAKRNGEWIVIGVATMDDSLVLAEKNDDSYTVLNKK